MRKTRIKITTHLAVLFLAMIWQSTVTLATLQNDASVILGEYYFGQDLVLAYTRQGLFRVTNEGWHLIYPIVQETRVSLGGAVYLYQDSTAEIRRSLDGGETWTLAGTFPFTDSKSSESFSASPITNTIFVGVGYSFTETGPLKGIYKSTDAGTTWHKVLEDRNAGIVTFSPNFANDGIAFTHFMSYKHTSGFWKTEDWGETWFPSNEGLATGMSLTGYTLSVSPGFAQDQMLFAISDLGTYKSANGGTSWFTVGDLPGYLPINIAISPNYDSDQTLLTGDYDEGLFLSQDGGESWQSLNFPASPRYVGIRQAVPYGPWPNPFTPTSPGLHRLYLPIVNIEPSRLEFWVLGFHPAEATYPRLYRSLDYGATWEEVHVFEPLQWLYLPLVCQE